MSSWTSWPSREALAPEGRLPERQNLARGIRLLFVAAAFWGILADSDLDGRQTIGAGLGLVAVLGAVRELFRATLRHRMGPDVVLLALLPAAAFVLQAMDARLAATLLHGIT